MFTIINHYEPSPDYRNIEDAARNMSARRLPLYEHSISGEIMEAIIGTNPCLSWYSSDESERDEAFRRFWHFWRTMGYDTASIECTVCGALIGGGALTAPDKGVIRTREDFEKYPWDEILERYITMYTPLMDSCVRTVLPGMKAVGGVGNGPFEAVQDLVGYTNLCYLRNDDPETYGAIFRRMSDLQYAIWEWFMGRYSNAYCVMRIGDDLGYKSGPLLTPSDIRAYIIPHYRRITDLVHSYDKPFLLHSCGAIFDVMDDLICDGGIDAKHSNEDQVAPFTEWVNRYGNRIGNFGGIDMDVVCRADHDTIKCNVKYILDQVAGKGGIAFSTGNSIPDYVPAGNYVTMVEAVRVWRGE